jgi:hypothetical protein
VVADISFLRTPDGHGQLELTTYRKPLATTVERLKAHGGELVGTIEEYTPSKYFCYLRGPQGIIIALAED